MYGNETYIYTFTITNNHSNSNYSDKFNVITSSYNSGYTNDIEFYQNSTYIDNKQKITLSLSINASNLPTIISGNSNWTVSNNTLVFNMDKFDKTNEKFITISNPYTCSTYVYRDYTTFRIHSNDDPTQDYQFCVGLNLLSQKGYDYSNPQRSNIAVYYGSQYSINVQVNSTLYYNGSSTINCTSKSTNPISAQSALYSGSLFFVKVTVNSFVYHYDISQPGHTYEVTVLASTTKHDPYSGITSDMQTLGSTSFIHSGLNATGDYSRTLNITCNQNIRFNKGSTVYLYLYQNS